LNAIVKGTDEGLAGAVDTRTRGLTGKGSFLGQAAKNNGSSTHEAITKLRARGVVLTQGMHLTT
jgi:hypothetical protein